jgi:hypothetical protein
MDNHEGTPEHLLQLIYEDKLTDENVKMYLRHIDYSRDPNQGYLTPLMNAIHHGRKRAIAVLLKARANPTIIINVSIKIQTFFQL